MKTLGIIFTILLFQLTSKADIRCTIGGGNFPYWVFNSETNSLIGNSGYSEPEFCSAAIKSSDPSFVCAPNAKGGSSVYNANNGAILGFDQIYFTSITFCSQAILNVSDKVICLPRSANEMVLVDYKGVPKTIGEAYSSIEFCKNASASASTRDPYICAMNPKGYTEIFNRGSNIWLGVAFNSVNACLNHLNRLRGK
jgi:hypothetical protein